MTSGKSVRRPVVLRNLDSQRCTVRDLRRRGIQECHHCSLPGGSFETNVHTNDQTRIIVYDSKNKRPASNLRTHEAIDEVHVGAGCVNVKTLARAMGISKP